MNEREPHHFEAPAELHLSEVEAREWVKLQEAICEKLVNDHVTDVNQLDPELLPEVKVHLAVCDVEDHNEISGLYSQD